MYVEIVALEFGEDPKVLADKVFKADNTGHISEDIKSWTTEYDKVKNLRPKITIDKITKELKVTGLTGLIESK